MLKNLVLTTLVLFCAFGLFLVGAAGSAEAASKFAYPCSSTSGSAQVQQICIMNSDGSGETQLTNFNPCEYQPGLCGSNEPIEQITWSPDGTMLAYPYVNPTAGGCFIVIIDAADGSVLSELLQTEGCSPYPRPVAWSPEIAPNVAAISPLGQLVIVFLLGAVTALYFSRQRGQASGLVGS